MLSETNALKYLIYFERKTQQPVEDSFEGIPFLGIKNKALRFC